MLKNTDHSYGLISKILHWAMAVIILSLLSVGFYMSAMAFSPPKLQIYGLHKSFGMIILMLVGLRILWKGLGSPKHLDTHAPWERGLAKLIHVLLYFAMIGMPLSGWIMSSAGEFPNIFFGFFEFPALTDKDEALFKLMKNVHEFTAFALIGGIGLHMAGTFKHHFIDGDETLRRMTRTKLGFLGGAALAVFAGALWGAPILIKAQDIKTRTDVKIAETNLDTAMSQDIQSGWLIDLDKSHIDFEVTQYGQPFSGGFENFNGEVFFDPDDLENSHVKIVIDIASLFTGSDDRDEQARGVEWFDAPQYPDAVFEANEFLVRKPNHTKPNHYEARGNLSLRSVNLPLILPFTLDIQAGDDGVQRAFMDASIILKRLDYGVGQGQWEATDTIGNDVILDIHIEADKAR